MRTAKSRWVSGLIALCVVSLAGEVHAHGQVTSDSDACVIRIGVFEAHFKLYQPQERQQEEFCEDLPGAGETVLVMEYLSPALRESPLELRIIRDLQGRKKYARESDLQDIADIEAVTVFHQAPRVDPDVFAAVFTFDQPGWYIGIITAKNPMEDKSYTAVFPIEVGFTGPGYLLPLLGVLLLLQLGYWWMNGRLSRWRKRFRARQLGLPDDHGQEMIQPPARRRASVLARFLVCFSLLAFGDVQAGGEPACVSTQGTYHVSYRSELDPIGINQIHDWVLHVTSAAGQPVSGAEITITGGMPQHNHGLPTQPLVTADAGSGDYLVEGLRFHMPGDWQLSLSIKSGLGPDTCVIVLHL